jgi:heat shock protein HslJ
MDLMTRGLTGLLLALSLLTACGETTDTEEGTDVGTPADQPSPVDLPLGEYVSSEVTGHELVPGTEISLTWTDGQLRVQAGCNTLSGNASVEDGRLRVENLGGTEMGCEPELMDQDTWLADFLAAGPEVAGTGGGFALAGAGTEIRFVPVTQEPDLPLEGTTWVLETIQQGDVASSGTIDPESPVAGGPRAPELRIAQDEISGFDGCNMFRGPVEIDDGTLRAEELLSTKRACVDPAATETARLLGELLRESSYAVEGDRLTLSSGDLAVVFRAR